MNVLTSYETYNYIIIKLTLLLVIYIVYSIYIVY